MKKAILVLGAPRSGTSVVSHVIHKLGVDFGNHDRFVDPKVHVFNPIFFELQSLNNLNDEIFAYFSKKFTNFDWVPGEGDFGNEVIAKFEKKITEFIDDEFSKSKTIGLKDTRFCFTLPIWDVVLKRLGFDVRYVLTRRFANSVFVSNKVENKYSSEVNFRIVVQSTLLARHYVEGKKHVMVRYEDLLAAPDQSILRLCDGLSLDRALIGEARSVISEDLNHQKRKADLFIYNYFESVIDSDSVSPDEYLRYREIFLAATFETDQRIASLSQTVSERDGQITRLNQAVVERDVQITGLNQAVVERDVQITGLQAQVLAMNVELLKLNAERATFGAKVGRAITRLRAKVAPIGSLRGEVVKATAKIITSLVTSGFRNTASKSCQLVFFKVRVNYLKWRTILTSTMFIQKNQLDGENQSTLFKVEASHPQLSAWIDANEPTSLQLLDQVKASDLFHYRPLISAIIPIYKVPRDVLNETISSLEMQTYGNWQACIVWSDVHDKDGWHWLEERVASDPRFKIKMLSENGGISRNSNSAFALVDGEFIALLDHDDTLTPWAFYEVVKLLQAKPVLDFIYSDKDSIVADGMVRLNALFKPQWSPEMLHSVNYLTHLNIIRSSLVSEIGGWNPETDGAQDWDLFFRITERTNNIARVPSILYHWRILPTSTATGLAAKPYAALGQLKTQQSYFTRRGLSATVIPSPQGMFKVCWPEHAKSTDVAIYQNGTMDQLIGVLNALIVCNQECIRQIHVVHSTIAHDLLRAFEEVWGSKINFTRIDSANWQTALEAASHQNVAETIILLDGSATGLSNNIVEELGGWVAQHPDIAWASAIALDLKNSNVYEAGRVVSVDNKSAPLFNGSALFSFGWFGGPLWYRNARACSPYAIAIKGQDVLEALMNQTDNAGSRDNFVAFCRALCVDHRRGLIDPFARVYFSDAPEEAWPNDGAQFHNDPYFHPAFDQVSPLRLK